MSFFGLSIARSRITEANIRHALEKVSPFPYLSTDENSAFGKGRIVAFRSKEEWLIVFELLVYIGEIDEYVRKINSFGNRLKVNKSDIIEDLFSLVNDDDIPNPFDFEIFLASTKRKFHFDIHNYAEAGIDLNKPISGDVGFDRRVQILRLLAVHISPQELFLSHPDLLKVLGRPATLPVFIELYKWCHPNPRTSASPVASPSIESLIKALIDNNSDLYKCPPSLINSDWAHWPDF